jgi:hypothetical protein
MGPISTSTLDRVLAMQFAIAWAGEGRCEPARLGWWETDLIDAGGGGDLMSRLLPRTHAWASLDAVREAARRVDADGRRQLAKGDSVRTLFFLGFEADEQLAERIGELKRGGESPSRALPWPIDIESVFSRDVLANALRLGTRKADPFEVVPGGRQMKAEAPDALELLVKNLADALVPLGERYPLPFYRAAKK